MATQQVNYVSDPRDKIILAVTPTLMVPHHGEIDWPLVIGSYRFLIAQNGLFVEAKSTLLHTCFQISDLDNQILPYGSQKSFCSLTHGLVPACVKHELLDRCRRSGGKEYAAYIAYDTARGYYLLEPTVISRSSHHISYHNNDDIQNVLCDVHTHGNGEAYFSATDNASDTHGIYIAIVVGRCHQDELQIKARLVVHGKFCDIDWLPFEDEK